MVDAIRRQWNLEIRCYFPVVKGKRYIEDKLSRVVRGKGANF
jgi:hypothetical protein